MSEQDTAAATDTGTESKDQDDVQGQAATTETPKNDETITVSQAELDRRIGAAAFKAKEKAEAELEARLEAERAEMEKAKLADQGKYKELAENQQAELDALRAELERNEFTSQARKALKEANADAFTDVLLNTPDTVDGVKQRAESIRALIDAQVQAEVAQRMETGSHVVSTDKTKPPSSKSVGEMTTEEWAEERKRRGYTNTTPPHLRGAKTGM